MTESICAGITAPAGGAGVIAGNSTADQYSKWWRIYRREQYPGSRIICLPHAGGSASFFRSWSNELPAGIELAAIQYPGHEDRLDEPLISSMDELVTGICDSISSGGLLNKPYMLFGHSMGGYVAYELCREIQKRGLKEPYHVFVSASEAPGYKDESSWHTSSDKDLLTEIRRVFGNEHPCENKEVADLFLPVIRNDYRLIESWEPDRNSQPLKVDFSAFYADADTEMNTVKANGWKNITSSRFETRKFTGNHFYLIKEQREVIRAVVDVARKQRTKRLMLP